MSQKVAMRSGLDRLRYTLSFELSLMFFLVPTWAYFFDRSYMEVGLLGIVLAIKAMVVNLIYNWVFDTLDARSGRVSSERSTLGRIFHAVGFEGCLLVTSLPLYMWWLDLTVWGAITLDLVVTSFIVVFTYFFTLLYDRLFPVSPLANVEA